MCVDIATGAIGVFTGGDGALTLTDIKKSKTSLVEILSETFVVGSPAKLSDQVPITLDPFGDGFLGDKWKGRVGSAIESDDVGGDGTEERLVHNVTFLLARNKM